MMELSSTLSVTLVKSDLENFSDILQKVGKDLETIKEKDFFSLLEHFSSTWLVRAPYSVWEELQKLGFDTFEVDTPDLEFYIPDSLVDSERAVLENTAERLYDDISYLRDLDRDSLADLLLPRNLVRERLVTTNARHLAELVLQGISGTEEVQAVFYGLLRVFEELAPEVREEIELYAN